VKRAAELGWPELKNGLLLTAAENAGFDVLLAGDKTIRHQQNRTARRIALVVMSDNHWPIVKHDVSEIMQSIEQARPGEAIAVDCGAFVARKSGIPDLPESGGKIRGKVRAADSAAGTWKFISPVQVWSPARCG